VAALALAAVAIPADNQILDEADAFVDSKPETETAKLEAKLAKLQHTYDRIKKSCVANDIPSLELGEDDDAKETTKADTAEELKEKIKSKNAQIDKIADACMPGEEFEQTSKFGE